MDNILERLEATGIPISKDGISWKKPAAIYGMRLQEGNTTEKDIAKGIRECHSGRHNSFRGMSEEEEIQKGVDHFKKYFVDYDKFFGNEKGKPK